MDDSWEGAIRDGWPKPGDAVLAQIDNGNGCDSTLDDGDVRFFCTCNNGDYGEPHDMPHVASTGFIAVAVWDDDGMTAAIA